MGVYNPREWLYGEIEGRDCETCRYYDAPATDKNCANCEVEYFIRYMSNWQPRDGESCPNR